MVSTGNEAMMTRCEWSQRARAQRQFGGVECLQPAPAEYPGILVYRLCEGHRDELVADLREDPILLPYLKRDGYTL